jgi:hypothetical protein
MYDDINNILFFLVVLTSIRVFILIFNGKRDIEVTITNDYNNVGSVKNSVSAGKITN